MNSQRSAEGDSLHNLPSDPHFPPSPEEVQTVKDLFGEITPTQKAQARESFNAFRLPLLIGLLFLIFSLPFFDAFLIRMIPGLTSIFLLGVKTLLVVVTVFVLVNWNLIQG